MYIRYMEFKSLLELLAYFKDESVCKEYLERMRWGGTIQCPHCGNHKIYRTNRGFKCAGCSKKFSVTSGTIFENTKLPLKTWFAAIYLCTAHKKGISSTQLHRDLGISQKTAWFLLHRIRQIMQDDSSIEGIVEVDETYVGGNMLNKPKSQRIKNAQGRSLSHKQPVVGILGRDNKVVAKPIPDSTAKTLKREIASYVKSGSTVITDSWKGYKNLNLMYDHQVVDHSKDEFVKGSYHINSVEGFFSMLKRGIIGIYHAISKKHLHRYCHEFSYRYNTREIKDCERFQDVFSNIKCRLTYKGLIHE